MNKEKKKKDIGLEKEIYDFLDRQGNVEQIVNDLLRDIIKIKKEKETLRDKQ